MPLGIADIAPYASFVVAHAKVVPVNFDGLRNSVKELFVGAEFSVQRLRPAANGLDHCSAFHLEEKRAVTWLKNDVVTDQRHHLLAVLGSGEFALVYMSDADLKSEIYDALNSGALAGWEPADHRVLVDAYVKNESLKALWLGGTHRDVSFRPSSKVLSGRHLQDAIEPFGDSTYVAGAVRTSAAGVSLKRSGVWFKPSRDWQGFHAQASTVLAALNARQATIATLSAEVHHGLAQQLSNLDNVEYAYAVQWAAPETTEGSTRLAKLEELSRQFQLDVAPLPQGANSSDLSLSIKPMAGAPIVVLLVPQVAAGRVTFHCGAIPADVADCVEAIMAEASLIKVYYDTGHTIVDATVCQSAIQDRAFALEYCDFAPNGFAYDVTKEKPPGTPVPLANMFTAIDESLFKWVFKDGLVQMGLAVPAAGSCWLYCDDGSGEVADFIHLDTRPALNPNIPRVTVIHVKGAQNDSARRLVAVGPYEVVTAQAMKNLRRMIAREMAKEVRRSVATHGDSRVWDSPWALGLASVPGTAAAMLAALDQVRDQCDYEVIVVQPHVRRTTYQANPDTTGARQLRSLLFGAQALTQAAGARFRVICEHA